jgi:uncharacterized repeat protein (TIGR03803 family)
VTQLSFCKTTLLLIILSAATAIAAQAQTFKTVVVFDGTNGSNPLGNLIQGPDGSYYGTTRYGGSYGCGLGYGCGSIFKVSPQGKLTTLYAFCEQQPCTDGISPWAGMVLGTDGSFYGTTYAGGNANSSAGTVFKISPSGKLTTLYTFCATTGCPDGAQPFGQLLEGPDGNFYGTTSAGGGSPICPGGCGTVFRISPSGALQTLHVFTANGGDGGIPVAGLTLGPDRDFYGTTSTGGNYGIWCVDYVQEYGCGTVFKVTPTGYETILYRFCADGYFCVTDGAFPYAALVLGSDGNFYGDAEEGGGQQTGSLFKITPRASSRCFTTFAASGVAGHFLARL